PITGELTMQFNRFAFVVIAATTSLAALAATPLGTAFTYQGQLKQNGAPVNGLLSMSFSLFDAQSGGNQIGPTLTADVFVTNGLFTKDLGFGAGTFSGNAAWLAITVGGTALAPRQTLNPAPNALYAVNGCGWQQSAGALSNTGGTFVGINRSTSVTGAEYFGIQAPVTSGYG